MFQDLDPTRENYGDLNQAYTYFNKKLFDGELPKCLITMQRKSGSLGYFSGNRWEQRGSDGEVVVDEIALNPTHFKERTMAQTLSTLVHEMCHLWQHHFGNPGRGAYHNKEWATKMLSCGLIPSHTGQEGGKQTGQNMTHYIEAGGVFETSCNALLKTGFELRYSDRAVATAKAKKSPNSKTKYSCPSCGLNVWGKPDIYILCGDCSEEMMEA